jgi:hypothetical protein
MRRELWILAIFLTGCTCNRSDEHAKPAGPAQARAEGGGPGATPGRALQMTSEARYSLPIAAARLTGGEVVVAGIVADAKSIGITGLGVREGWSADAIPDIAWSDDADLRVYPAADGAAIVWRGLKGGRTGRYLALVGPRGEERAPVAEIGATPCSTLEGLAWIEHTGDEPFVVRARGWSSAAPVDLGHVPAERDPTLVCGDHDVFILADGEDDLTVAAATGVWAAAGSPTVAILDGDFGEDKERQHEAYSVGEDLGIVRVGDSGVMSWREMHGGVLSPWRKLEHKLGDDDEIIALDADTGSLVIVTSQDESDACKEGATAESVRAIAVDRASGAETRTLLAAADCGREIGNAWVALSPAGPTVAWAERGRRTASKSAPIRALFAAKVGVDASAPRRFEQLADGMVEAGCDPAGGASPPSCYEVALVRDPASDGMGPEALRLLPF